MMSEHHRLLFVSWAKNCSRSDSIARHLGGESYMVYAARWGSRWSTILFKYIAQAVMTLRLLIRHRPRVVMVMTPPVAACLPVWLYSKATKGVYVIDAHTGAFVDPRWQKLMFIHRFFSRAALTTIVTNTHLEGLVRGWRADATVVGDVPILFPTPTPANLKQACSMTLVSTFTPDEPTEAFLLGAARVPEIHFYVTGPIQDAVPRVREMCPPNVTFTGFLPDAEYVGLLLASMAVICLTTADHTMQRGAYEAIYLGKPVVTSNFGILRQAFSRGAVHVDNTPEDIARGVIEMRDHVEQYRREAQQLRLEKLEQWATVQKALLQRLCNGVR
jgi:hypothetical protein